MRKRVLSPFSVIIVFVFFLIIGISLINSLSVNLLPTYYLPSLSISFNWTGASARVIERNATSIIESEFSKMSEFEKITSTSMKGTGSIIVTFNKDTDMEIARFNSSMAIRNISDQLPENISYPIIQINRSTENSDLILTYSLYGDLTEEEIIHVLENQLQPAVSRIDGISAFNIFGTKEQVMLISYDNQKLQLLNIDINTLIKKLREYLVNINLGFTEISTTNSRESSISLRIDGAGKSNIKWEELPLIKTKDKIIYLGDVASINWGYLPQRNITRINGLPTAGFNIYVEKNANTYDVSNQIKKTIQNVINKSSCSINLKKTYDVTNFLNKEFSKVMYRAIIALVVLLLFVLIISRSWRYLIIILSTVVFNLGLSVILFKIFKVEIHIYALAGLTISLGMIIDNAIIIIDHIRYKRKHSAFLSVFAATLTTIGALSIIFLLDYKTQLNLIDFSLVVIINLVISLLIALFLIPALMHYWSLSKSKKSYSLKKAHRIITFNALYERFIKFQLKRKWIWIVLLILIFGLPINELPPKIEKDSPFTAIYNQTIGSKFYQKKLKKSFENIFGGTYRLFSKYIFEAGIYGQIGETKLFVTAQMPKDATLAFANNTIKKIEGKLINSVGIDHFTTTINSNETAKIEISFKESYEKIGFPNYLKVELQNIVSTIGGVGWRIEGVGKAYYNSIGTRGGSSNIMLYGFNYEQLVIYAKKFSKIIEENKRVQNLEIKGSYYGSNINRKKIVAFLSDQTLAKRNIHPVQIYNQIKAQAAGPKFLGQLSDEIKSYELYILPNTTKFEEWDLLNYPMKIENEYISLKEVGEIEQQSIGHDIHKKNQEYQLVISYDFGGSDRLERQFQKDMIKLINNELPIGYTASEPDYAFWKTDKLEIARLIPIVIFIIFLLLAILFESLKQPLSILSLILISFSGIFLTFYWFDIQFDQGGYAAFILIAGISVNAALYIINEFNIIRKLNKKNNIKNYIKAYSNKIIPILLTIISTILGLIPFLTFATGEPFWYAFAAGSIGGLIFSLIGLLIWLPPLLLKPAKKK